MPVTLNLKEFNTKLDRSFRKTAEILGDEFQSQLTEEKRNYPRTTYRKEGRGVTGIVARSPRDVVDTEELVNSYNYAVVSTSQQFLALYQWDADHAILVYTGWTSGKGTNVPPYPWCHRAIAQVDLPKLFQEAWSG